MIRSVSLVLSGIAALGIGLSAQPGTTPAGQDPPRPPPVTFRVEVALVQVDAVVTDGARRVIRDLRANEFQVFEDGRRQTLDSVSFVEMPIGHAARAAAVASPAEDVRTNLHRFDGRLYVLLLDDLHTTPGRSERLRDAARQFVAKHLEPEDLAAVVHVSGAGGASQDFTADRDLLLASIDRFAGRKTTSETLNRIEDYNRRLLFSGRTPERTTDHDEAPRANDARTAFATLAAIANRLAPVGGRRKALLWFGEGIAYDMFELANRTLAPVVLESSRAAVSAAARANLAIYGVDARGLSGLRDEALQISHPAADPTRKLDASGLNEELFRSQSNLRRVSEATGGFAVVNTGELARAFTRVVEESSAYYLLGYHPADGRRDGGFRRLEVRVTRPGANVRARGGYVAPSDKVEETPADARSPGWLLADALASPVPQTGLPMAIHVAPFVGRGGRHSVLVTVEYGASTFPGGDSGAPPPALETSVIALNSAGAVEASNHSTIALDASPDTRKAMAVVGFRTHTRLDLAAGRYRIRAAAALADQGRAGSVHTDLVVPDFPASRLAISGLVLTSMTAGFTPTARLDERLREVLPAPPTATRDFRNDEAIAMFAEIYESGHPPRNDVRLRTEVRDASGRVLFTREEDRGAEPMKRSGGGYWLQLSLRQFAPGGYTLALTAESRTAGSPKAARETAFHVWEVPAK